MAVITRDYVCGLDCDVGATRSRCYTAVNCFSQIMFSTTIVMSLPGTSG